MRFYCETKSEIPLPPNYTFPQAFNYLNPECNSFYILEDDERGYVQCGGGKKACMVEYREPGDGGAHYRFAKGDESADPADIQMSNGQVVVRSDEVLTHNDAIAIFTAFNAGEPFPEKYRMNQTDAGYHTTAS